MNSTKTIDRSHLLGRLAVLFDRPGGRWILGLAASMYSLYHTGRFTTVFYDGVWGHRSRGIYFFDRHINYSIFSADFSPAVEDDWCFLYKPQKGDTIVDIGAGIGVETYYFSKVVGSEGKVISIEAHPKTYQCLNKMCSYNNLFNVIPIHVAIHENNSAVSIDDPRSHINATILNSTGGYEVSGSSVDSIADFLSLTQISFLKMNIEGAERLAIQGMNQTIGKIKYICISCHDFLADRGGDEHMRTREKVQNYLAENGFKIVARENDPRDWISNQVNAYNPDLLQF